MCGGGTRHPFFLANVTPPLKCAFVGACMNLQQLNLSMTHVTDVSALGACLNLRKLDLTETHVTDVSALRGCEISGP